MTTEITLTRADLHDFAKQIPNEKLMLHHFTIVLTEIMMADIIKFIDGEQMIYFKEKTR